MTDDVATVEPPQVALLRMMTGYWVAQDVSVAARLGIADHLRDGPLPVADLATATGTHARSLHRLLRALASAGVFAETGDGAFGLTPAAEFLRSDAPDSMRSLAIMYGGEQYRAWADLFASVRTGEPVFEQVFGAAYFPYLAAHPEADRTFNEAMTGWSAQVDRALVAAYDFSPFGTVIDVGGGHGRMLAAILAAYPTVRGVLFDQPRVVAGAESQLAAAGVAARCELVGGDFFESVPAGGDAYVLAQILHDWDDGRSARILANCRRAIAPNGRLLLVELVIAPGNAPDFGTFLDLHMMTLLGGRERTAEEYAALLAAAGFELGRVVPTGAGASIVEAVPA